MAERPILFSAPMVRALLDGRKTQTRRVVKPQPVRERDGTLMWRVNKNSGIGWEGQDVHPSLLDLCPYGQPGDRLWVRETFYAFGRWETRFSRKKGRDEWHFIDMTAECGKWYFYAATSAPDAESFRRSSIVPMWWKRPAIFMPRAASRIDLHISAERVEQLNDISEDDAWAEGCARGSLDDYGRPFPAEEPIKGGLRGWDCARDWYADLWDEINGEDAFEANPWVWVVEFRHIKGAPHA